MTELLRLAAGRSVLRLAPAVGGAVADWRWGGAPVLRPLADGAAAVTAMASYPLVPFSNRVAGRRFSFAGLTHELPALLGEWAIHGAGWRLPWAVAEAGEARAVLSLAWPGGELWPFAFTATQTFALHPDGLVCTLAVRNDAEHVAPLAAGMHPFFPRLPGTRLHFAAAHVWEHDAQQIPTRRVAVPAAWDHRHGRPVGEVEMDHCFAGWNGQARIVQPELGLAIGIAAEALFRHAVVYIPPGRDFFCFEPVANMTDGINRIDGATDHGMVLAKPGEWIGGSVRFGIEELG